MNNLRQIIKEATAEKGIISFRRFMELALYCPKIGYYERVDESPGRTGDFYTSVSVGSLFGELLAAQISEWLEALPGPRQILEAGAHDGQLASDIWQCLETNHSELIDSTEYWILEPSVQRQESQRKKLKKFGPKVRWFESWDQLARQTDGIHGVILSNELLDAMPVHRMGWDAKKQEWFEWGVMFEGDEFVFKGMAEMESANIPQNLPPELLAVLPDGFTTELSPAANEWWRNAASNLKAGRIITFDYGLTGEEFFVPQRKDGNLRAYHQHRQSDDLLANPGEQDVTAQVNFSEIIKAGETGGLKTELFDSQGRFLTGVLERGLARNSVFKDWSRARARQFQTLTHPQHLGHLFKVLVQSR